MQIAALEGYVIISEAAQSDDPRHH